jgi:wobble nucleotide-excising tRNase
MKIDKIVTIKDIGRFANYSAKGMDGNLSEISLIYGPNGSGKSTLAAIFRSLEKNSNRSISKRRRVGVQRSHPEVAIRAGNQIVRYRSGQGWDANQLSVSVYDSAFVNENIYSGEAVFKEQRSSLFLLLFLDGEGLALLQEAEQIDVKISEINKEVYGVSASIAVAAGIKLKDFSKYLSRSGKIKEGHAELQRLLAEVGFSALVRKYVGLEGARFEKAQIIKEKKTRIVEIAEEVLGRHQNTINKYLRKLSAGFSIRSMGVSNFSSDLTQRLKYSIVINDIDQNIFETNTVNHGKPYFDTLLSDADKRTLSFAFFMSKIENDEAIDKRVVVFDDPMSSFDSARKTATKQEILSLSEKVAQVIVLSHDIDFLASFWLDSKVRSSSILQVRKIAGFASELREWDIGSDYDSEHMKNYKLLHAFLEGNPVCTRSVATLIRVVLEEHFRQKFPMDFVRKEWLGDFLKKVRECSGGHNLFAMKQHLVELSEICEYASPFHHAPQPEVENDELLSYVRRTINILQA